MDLDRPFLWGRLSVYCHIDWARNRLCRLAGVLFEPFLANVRKVAVWTDQNSRPFALSSGLGDYGIWMDERQSQYGDVVLLAKLLRCLGDCLC